MKRTKHDRERIRQRARERARRIRERVIKKYGGRCQCPGCGVTQYEFLVIDHVNGGGSKERREKWSSSSQTFFTYLDRHPRSAKYQVLCQNCNSAKAYHSGCPHHKNVLAPIIIIGNHTYIGQLFESLPAA